MIYTTELSTVMDTEQLPTHGGLGNGYGDRERDRLSKSLATDAFTTHQNALRAFDIPHMSWIDDYLRELSIA